jgi:hypothetical protein
LNKIISILKGYDIIIEHSDINIISQIIESNSKINEAGHDNTIHEWTRESPPTYKTQEEITKIVLAAIR